MAAEVWRGEVVVQLATRIPKGLQIALKHYSIDSGIPISDLVTESIRRTLLECGRLPVDELPLVIPMPDHHEGEVTRHGRSPAERIPPLRRRTRPAHQG